MRAEQKGPKYKHGTGKNINGEPFTIKLTLHVHNFLFGAIFARAAEVVTHLQCYIHSQSALTQTIHSRTHTRRNNKSDFMPSASTAPIYNKFFFLHFVALLHPKKCGFLFRSSFSLCCCYILLLLMIICCCCL